MKITQYVVFSINDKGDCFKVKQNNKLKYQIISQKIIRHYLLFISFFLNRVGLQP